MSAKTTTRRLVIVESPAKARTIERYLGSGYVVLSSVGHIRDMPTRAAEVPEKYRGSDWARTGVDVANDFAPLYVISGAKKKTVADLRKALGEADELLLATDEDREGEAIAWHLKEVLRPTIPTRRMVFHEITPEAIAQAAENTREINADLVDAQETRRIVDRLFGYEVSPVLWRRVRPKLSAGRVQSVAVRLIVDRERERIAFVPADYSDVRGTFTPGEFAARLTSLDGRRVATGRDFDEAGQLRSDQTAVVDPATAESLADRLTDAEFTVSSVERRPKSRKPAAPFMTSTLQQAAGARLRWTAKRTMGVAQRLYEGGFITYMRTDSTTLSAQAISAARRQATDLYGSDHIPDAPRRYDRKVKNAQEAHEAIRPAGDVFRTPGQVSGELNGDDFTLYELIWQRTVASQMADAKVATTTMRLNAGTDDGHAVEFTASGTVVVFKGFLAAYEDVRENKEGDAVALPSLEEGQVVRAGLLEAQSHRTSPPARYTEATLVRALEERGIGRPSTYASIIGTIQDREYVQKRGSALVPSFLGMAVTRLMEEHFADLVDYSFTARMEEILDQIARGDESRLRALESFYAGDVGMGFDGLQPLLESSGDIDARAVSTFPISGSDAVLRVGRYGPYLERGDPESPDRANIPEDMAPDELTAESVAEIFAQPRGDRELGTDPESGNAVVVKSGRFGPYVTEVLPEDAPAKAKPRTASLFKDMSLETVDLEQALLLLSLPREVGTDPKSGETVLALNGRYGPYLKLGTDTRSLADESQIFTVTLEEAQRLFAEPRRRRGQASSAPLRELGDDPASGQPMLLKDGRFGPYVTDGEYNATVPRAENPLELTAERAAELLAERRAKGPAKKSGRKRAPAKKTTAAKKRSPSRRSPAKKATTKKAKAKQGPEADTAESSEPAGAAAGGGTSGSTK